LVFMALWKGFGFAFMATQSISTGIAMVFNFTINNVLTYRDQRLHDRRWWFGLASFVVTCSVGALANVGVASYLFLEKTQ